jgi:ABC-type bacteriocin/lantibiotic exporter with double-glycine peptidase domain
MKLVIFCLLVAVVLSRSYPLYKQCDSKWGSQHIGTSSKTICQVGCLMSSASMALAGTGHSYNPGTLNTWLKSNGGYASGDLFVWTAINKLGLTYKGKVANANIKKSLDAGNIVIMNVHGGAHWVLAHGYSGDNILVNDPGYSTTSYSLSQIVSGNSGLYSVNKMPNFINEWVIYLEEVFGLEAEPVVQDEIAHSDEQTEILLG